MKHSEGFLNIVNDAKSRIREVTVAETQARNPDAKLIDVREDNEWGAGHAAGAIHLGKGIIERDIETTVPDKATELIDSLLRWRVSLGARYGRVAEDGLHKRVLDGRWLESVERSGREN